MNNNPVVVTAKAKVMQGQRFSGIYGVFGGILIIKYSSYSEAILYIIYKEENRFFWF